MQDIVLQRYENARKSLVDLSLRNRFLNYRINNKRGLRFVSPSAREIYNTLVIQHAKVSLAPEPGDGEEALEVEHRDDRSHVVYVSERKETIDEKILELWRESRSIQDERGLNLLFVAIGFLKWYEADSTEKALYAPLILVPVLIERAKDRKFYLMYEDTEVVTNLSLGEKMKEFGISLPDTGDDEDLDVEEYFKQLEQRRQERWEVCSEMVVLNLFDYTKYVMYKDLDPDNWQIGQHAVLNSLLSGECLFESADSIPDDNIDKVRPVENALEVYDADSSQVSAILRAKNAPLTVIQGPPGTGKSQTITNIIAEAVYEGKKVLFVSEKRAALEVVWRRLNEADLSPICLELHSSKSHKAGFYAELKSTWQEGPKKRAIQESILREIEQKREYLNSYCNALHTPVGKYGVTPFQCIAELCRIGAERGKFRPEDFQVMKEWTKEDFEKASSLVEKLQLHVARYGLPSRNPFWGSQVQNVTYERWHTVREAVASALRAANHAKQAFEGLPESLGNDLLQAVRSNITVWRHEIQQIREAFFTYHTRWYRSFISRYRRCEKLLRDLIGKKLYEQIREPAFKKDILDTLNTIQAVVEADKELEHLLVNVLEAQELWKNWRNQPLQDQIAQLEQWNSMESDKPLQDLARFNRLRQEAKNLGIADFAEYAAKWDEADKDLLQYFQQVWYESILQEAIHNEPLLMDFDPLEHERIIKQFQELDQTLLRINRLRVALRHAENLPMMQTFGNISKLRHEFAKKQRHKPIRRIMQEAGDAVLAIKPVFLMSPLSVAVYLPPNSVTFDIVIFDEASQVKPADAFGAILRAKQVVIVGDDKQLPPTTFFERMTTDEDFSDEEEETDVVSDIESILDLAYSVVPKPHQLRWHYRSKHHSLIECSNRLYYNDSLVIPPHPDQKPQDVGVVFHYLPDGIYDRGRTRTNQREAEAVVDAIIQHIENHPDLSLGVAAFSMAQQRAIEDMLEQRRRDALIDAQLANFDKIHANEPLFIKNLETVQGDERDVIFISIGYGKDKDGHVSMNFGPLNKEGGERRLNVLISRARHRCEVFSSIRHTDIRTDANSPKGVIHLKNYLKFAETGEIEIPPAVEKDPMSPFEEEVIKVLQSWNYEVHPQVGCAGFYIDIGVVNPQKPGEYILGIECDGSQYHSSRSARDRDRLRQQILEQRGWRIYRIWSTSWYRQKQDEMRRLWQALQEAQNKPVNGGPPEATCESSTQNIDHTDAEEPESAREDLTGGSQTNTAVPPHEILPRYNYAQISQKPKLAQWLQDGYSSAMLSTVVVEIAKVEAPVHIEEVITRIRSAAGFKRTGARIRESILDAVKYAERAKKIMVDGNFIWTVPKQKPVPRNRSNVPDASRKAEYIHPEEIREAALQVVRTAFGIDEAELRDELFRFFGFKQVNDEMRKRSQEAIDALCQQKRLSRDQNGTLKIL
ncbi:MAG: DUF3320 domain-containing protein [Chthonomonadetes bacterium]|nr:DUF3320 domain-containing protein [Chthonomonadetes bacterium]